MEHRIEDVRAGASSLRQGFRSDEGHAGGAVGRNLARAVRLLAQPGVADVGGTVKTLNLNGLVVLFLASLSFTFGLGKSN